MTIGVSPSKGKPLPEPMTLPDIPELPPLALPCTQGVRQAKPARTFETDFDRIFGD